MRIDWLGRMDFRSCWQLQQEHLLNVVATSSLEAERILLVEHPHVFTLGRRGNADNILKTTDLEGAPIEVIKVNRGGDVTYHGPGQLVGYPVLNLQFRGRDVHRYLRQLESVLIRTASQLGVESFRREGLTGVWTVEGKLASIGVGVKRWITQHGFALNVRPDLRHFELINPCGIPECPVVSLESALDRSVTIEEVLPLLRAELQTEFEKTTEKSLTEADNS